MCVRGGSSSSSSPPLGAAAHRAPPALRSSAADAVHHVGGGERSSVQITQPQSLSALPLKLPLPLQGHYSASDVQFNSGSAAYQQQLEEEEEKQQQLQRLSIPNLSALQKTSVFSVGQSTRRARTSDLELHAPVSPMAVDTPPGDSASVSRNIPVQVPLETCASTAINIDLRLAPDAGSPPPPADTPPFAASTRPPLLPADHSIDDASSSASNARSLAGSDGPSHVSFDNTSGVSSSSRLVESVSVRL